MNEVNMSNNQLSSLDGCNFLQCVKFLNVSKNSLCRITKKNSPLRLGYLEELSLADNSILLGKKRNRILKRAVIAIEPAVKALFV